jgi:hypothetical protein
MKRDALGVVRKDRFLTCYAPSTLRFFLSADLKHRKISVQAIEIIGAVF